MEPRSYLLFKGACLLNIKYQEKADLEKSGFPLHIKPLGALSLPIKDNQSRMEK
jgi:hypothetical protein